MDITKLDTKIKEDFCRYHSYQENIEQTDGDGKMVEVTNPETKDDFMDRKIKQFIKDSVVSYRANKAAEDARQAELAKEVTVEEVK